MVRSLLALTALVLAAAADAQESAKHSRRHRGCKAHQPSSVVADSADYGSAAAVASPTPIVVSPAAYASPTSFVQVVKPSALVEQKEVHESARYGSAADDFRGRKSMAGASAKPSAAVVSIYPSAAQSQAAQASSAGSAVNVTSNAKKGLSFTNPQATLPWVGKNVGWAYNWWTDRGDELPKSMEYLPMAWCPTKISATGWQAAVAKAIAQGTTKVLGFNEPDQTGQCNIPYVDAASAHQTYMNPLKGKVAIGSPAVTNGGGSMGLTYMKNFLDACNGKCAIDFLTIHWYGNNQNAVYNFQTQVTKAIALAAQYKIEKVWITEFGLTGASAADTAKFVDAVLPWMDANPGVGGYAYFMCTDGSLNQNGAISPVLGAAYASP